MYCFDIKWENGVKSALNVFDKTEWKPNGSVSTKIHKYPRKEYRMGIRAIATYPSGTSGKLQNMPFLLSEQTRVLKCLPLNRNSIPLICHSFCIWFLSFTQVYARYPLSFLVAVCLLFPALSYLIIFSQCIKCKCYRIASSIALTVYAFICGTRIKRNVLYPW